METKASDLEVKEQLCVSTLLLFHHFNTQGSAVGFELRYLAWMKSHLFQFLKKSVLDKQLTY